MILGAKDILRIAGLIEPISEPGKCGGTSYGISVAGYDLRLGRNFMTIREDGSYHLFEDRDCFILEPGCFVLAETIERLNIPNNLIGLLKDKSTNARNGVSVFNTVFEPGWHGVPTIEIVNHGPRPVVLTSGMGIAQILFQQVSCETEGYSGKYQDQVGVTAARHE